MPTLSATPSIRTSCTCWLSTGSDFTLPFQGSLYMNPLFTSCTISCLLGLRWWYTQCLITSIRRNRLLSRETSPDTRSGLPTNFSPSGSSGPGCSMPLSSPCVSTSWHSTSSKYQRHSRTNPADPTTFGAPARTSFSCAFSWSVSHYSKCTTNTMDGVRHGWL